MDISTDDFKVGDYVEIDAPKFKTWHGRRGYVVEGDHDRELYVSVRVTGLGIGGWYPSQLIFVNTEAEARAALGDDYFD